MILSVSGVGPSPAVGGPRGIQDIRLDEGMDAAYNYYQDYIIFNIEHVTF